MISNVLRTLGGIEHYGILSLCLFCALFTGLLIWACSLKRNQLEKWATLPLESDPSGDQQLNPDSRHE